MKSVVLCLRGQKALAFAARFFAEYSDREHLFAYIDHEKRVATPVHDRLIEICTRHKVAHELTHKTRSFSDADTVISVGWTFMLEASNLLVVHDSLLPKYRGFNPLTTALIAGDREIGATVIHGGEKVDAGPILLQKSVTIEYPIRIRDAVGKLQPLYEFFAQSLAASLIGKPAMVAREQNEAHATFSVWRDDDDYIIDWSQSSSHIRRFIDSVGDPYLGALSYLNGKAVRIIAASELPDLNIANRTPGKVFAIEAGLPIVLCGVGLLRIEEAVTIDGESILPFRKLKSRFSSTAAGHVGSILENT